MKLSTKKVIITQGGFSPETTEYLWSLYHKYYAYSKESFLERMEKNNFFALYIVDGFLVGFTGLRINRATIHGKKRFFIYFGQTVIDKAHRGKSLIPLTGVKLCKMFFKDLLRSKAYFWAECLSYKAYLIFRNIGRLLWRFLNRSIDWQSHRQDITQRDRPTVVYACSNPLTALR